MSKKTRIYLGKSNRANPDLIQKVRKTLKEFDVEVVEFSGGAYSHKQLLTCDMLIVIPEVLTIEDFIDSDGDLIPVPLGKGLHEQITTFGIQIRKKCDTLIAMDLDDYGGWCVNPIDSLIIKDHDNYINYSTALVNLRHSHSLRFSLERDILPSTNVSSKSRYMLLLIK